MDKYMERLSAFVVVDVVLAGAAAAVLDVVVAAVTPVERTTVEVVPRAMTNDEKY
jgi:hypothetical protein